MSERLQQGLKLHVKACPMQLNQEQGNTTRRSSAGATQMGQKFLGHAV